MALLVIGFLILFFLWPVILAAVILFLIWIFWPEKKWKCLGCDKKFHREKSCKNHSQFCEQNRLREERIRQEEERRRREEYRKREEQSKREKHERTRKERIDGLKQDWRKNWRKREKWNFTEEEFWEIQKDIDERKDDATRDLREEQDNATEKLWDKYWDTDSESQQDRIDEKIDEIEEDFEEKIDEIEEDFEEEEERLWEEGYSNRWYKQSDQEKRAREDYEKAKQNYKNHTGRDWHEDDWNKWYDSFNDLLDDSVNLDECYAVLNLPRDAEFAQVKKRYRELALKHHPDKCENKEEAEKKFKEIVLAYEAIKNSIAV